MTAAPEDYQARAVEVLCRHRLGRRDHWSVGSGYLVTSDLVLTARHNIQPAEVPHPAGPVLLLVRFVHEREYEAHVVALGREPDDDIALIRIGDDGYRPRDLAVVRFATIDRATTHSVTGCWAVGFPRFKEVGGTTTTAAKRDSAHLEGVIPPGADLRRGLHEFRVTSMPASLAGTGTAASPWQGISGTLVFTQDGASSLAVGVITEHHLPAGTSSLTLVPVTRLSPVGLDGTSAVWELLGVSDPEGLPRMPSGSTLVPTGGEATPTRVKLSRFLADFSGREDEFVRISRILRRDPVRGSPVIVLYGMGGVGKTSLANHIGHLMASDYPYARVLVDLGGQGAEDMSLSAAVQQIFQAFGVPDSKIPGSLQARARLLQALYQEGRTLLILDNATLVQQVEVLLPQEPGPTASIITSRSPLPGLDGVRRIHLRPLPSSKALAMLTEFVDDETVLRDQDSVARLVRLTGGLPLALRIVAATINGPMMEDQPLRVLVERLEDRGHLLTHLEGGDRGVRASLEVSYQNLDADVASCFRAMGIIPGTTFTTDLVAAATEVDGSSAYARITALLDAQLLETTPQPDRFRMHDLVRLYAEEKAAMLDPAPVRDGVLRRVVQWYVVMSRVSLTPPSSPHRPSAAALAWFSEENLNVMAVLAKARDIGEWDQVAALAEALRPLLWYRRQWEELERTENWAVEAASRRERTRSELDALIQLAEARRKAGRPEEAEALYERAVELARAEHDEELEGWVLTHYGDLFCDLGQPEVALGRYESALALFEAIGDIGRQIWLSAHFIDALRQVGRPEEAIAVAARALDLAVEPAQTVWVRWHVALAECDLGRYDEAEDSLLVSVDHHREVRDDAGLAHMLLLLGEVRAAAGRAASAHEALTEALAAAERVKVPRMTRQINEDLAALRDGRPLRDAITYKSDL
ncbi:tetratricopeptide repeat protein [Microbispora sp. CA-135349]|uniref:ATP-binding protein n=1 Tax=Microbispora sp. CA-135349 TaxID=3239953 RepID=UPI003D943F97